MGSKPELADEERVEWVAEQIKDYTNLCIGRNLAKIPTETTAKDVARIILALTNANKEEAER